MYRRKRLRIWIIRVRFISAMFGLLDGQKSSYTIVAVNPTEPYLQTDHFSFNSGSKDAMPFRVKRHFIEETNSYKSSQFVSSIRWDLTYLPGSLGSEILLGWNSYYDRLHNRTYRQTHLSGSYPWVAFPHLQFIRKSGTRDRQQMSKGFLSKRG